MQQTPRYVPAAERLSASTLVDTVRPTHPIINLDLVFAGAFVGDRELLARSDIPVGKDSDADILHKYLVGRSSKVICKTVIPFESTRW